MLQRPFALVLAVLAVLALAAAAPAVGRSKPRPDEYLSITVTGMYADLVLVDPRRRVSLITPAGRESTFKGCQRLDVPEVGGVPDSLDYTRFYVREPTTGVYRLTMTARKPASIRVAVVASWSASGRGHSVGDDAGLEPMPGDKVTCTVVLKHGTSLGTGTLSAMISELSKRR